jgi:hypothetical protein
VIGLFFSIMLTGRSLTRTGPPSMWCGGGGRGAVRGGEMVSLVPEEHPTAFGVHSRTLAHNGVVILDELQFTATRSSSLRRNAGPLGRGMGCRGWAGE